MLPTVHGAIEFAVDGEIRPPIWVFGRKSFIQIDAEARSVTGMHHTAGKTIGMRKDALRLFTVVHILLNPKIMDAQIKMQRGRNAHGTHVRGPVAPGADMIEFRQASDLSHMRNSACVYHGGAN